MTAEERKSLLDWSNKEMERVQSILDKRQEYFDKMNDAMNEYLDKLDYEVAQQ